MRSAIALLTLAFASVGFSAPIGIEEPADTSGLPTYSSCNRPGVFALTFDDGPYQHTWDLAHALHAQGIKATFFTNGHNWVKSDLNTTTSETKDGPKTYMEVLQVIDSLGHELASHTYEHRNLGGLTVEEVEYQMNTQSDLIFAATGKRVALMRPPEGVTDSVSRQALNDLGYSNIMWDIDPKDYIANGLEIQMDIVRGVVEQDVANVTNGHICLQHDVHESSVNDLTPAIIEYITGKGYEFVTVSECLGIEAYHVTEEEQQPVAEEQQPVADEQQPVAEEQQPVAEEQQPVVDGPQSAVI